MKTTNAIFKLMMGTAAVVLSFAALSFASSNAKADPQPEFINGLTQTTDGSGKYRVEYFCGLDGNDKFYWHVCISNTQTGQFTVYRWSRDDQDWKDNFGKQVPSLP